MEKKKLFYQTQPDPYIPLLKTIFMVTETPSIFTSYANIQKFKEKLKQHYRV